jgi:phage portal protein BeeE
MNSYEEPPALKRLKVPVELYRETLNPYARPYRPRACKKLNPNAAEYVPSQKELDAAAALLQLRNGFFSTQ